MGKVTAISCILFPLAIIVLKLFAGAVFSWWWVLVAFLWPLVLEGLTFIAQWLCIWVAVVLVRFFGRGL